MFGGNPFGGGFGELASDFAINSFVPGGLNSKRLLQGDLTIQNELDSFQVQWGWLLIIWSEEIQMEALEWAEAWEDPSEVEDSTVEWVAAWVDPMAVEDSTVEWVAAWVDPMAEDMVEDTAVDMVEVMVINLSPSNVSFIDVKFSSSFHQNINRKILSSRFSSWNQAEEKIRRGCVGNKRMNQRDFSWLELKDSFRKSIALCTMDASQRTGRGVCLMSYHNYDDEEIQSVREHIIVVIPNTKELLIVAAMLISENKYWLDNRLIKSW
jgi:hypothetical protein